MARRELLAHSKIYQFKDVLNWNFRETVSDYLSTQRNWEKNWVGVPSDLTSLAIELQELLESYMITLILEDDRFSWKHSSNCAFSVKSSYCMLFDNDTTQSYWKFFWNIILYLK